MALTEEFGLSLSQVRSIKAGFAEWDVTNSGTISLTDIAHVLEKAGLEFDATDMHAMAGMVDQVRSMNELSYLCDSG